VALNNRATIKAKQATHFDILHYVDNNAKVMQCKNHHASGGPDAERGTSQSSINPIQDQSTEKVEEGHGNQVPMSQIQTSSSI